MAAADGRPYRPQKSNWRIRPISVHLFYQLAPVFLTLVLALTSSSTLAQDALDDVHLEPHPGQTTPVPDASIDLTLKTHTKPLVRDVDLVLVPITVVDSKNRLVLGLDKDSFAVYEVGQKQDIRYFSNEDTPLSLGIIFDTSASMKDKIEQSRESVVDFFKTTNSQDEFFMISFSDKPVLLADFTESAEDIQNRLAFAVPLGRTALLDAIYLGLDQMKKAKHRRKVLLIISDGGDNQSRYTKRAVKYLAMESDVQIYAIGIYSIVQSTLEERMGPEMLAEISEATGGHAIAIHDPDKLADAVTTIGTELRNQYVLAYRPKNPVHDGKWHKIRVKMTPPKGSPSLRVYSKTGYYAPTE
jgi:Ca-activated chloride channel homolog